MISRLAIIPARGGSKRLPRKNIMQFMGKPMLGWSIECAKESGLFDRILVSTEDAEIGNIAETSGAVWSHRPPDLAGDKTTVAEVCLDLLRRESAEKRVYNTMVCLYATAPLRLVEDIHEAVRLVEAEHADFVMSVTDFVYNPFEAIRIDNSGNASLMWPELAALSRFERPVVKVDAGSTYAVSTEAFLKYGDFYGPNLKVFEIPPERAVDIDDQVDFEKALMLAKRNHKLLL